MKEKYCILLGNGFDDIEAISIINLVRRAEINIDIYGINTKQITSFTKVIYYTDFIFSNYNDIDINDYNGLLLPGGPGVTDLLKNEQLIKLISCFGSADKIIYAICGAPVLLYKAGLLKNKKYTCLPSVAEMIKDGNRIDEKVVIDGRLITSKALGTSFHGAVEFISMVGSKEHKDKLMNSYYIELT